jgi:hypothetical protein
MSIDLIPHVNLASICAKYALQSRTKSAWLSSILEPIGSFTTDFDASYLMVLFAARTPYVPQKRIAQHSHFIQRIAILAFARSGVVNKLAVQDHDKIAKKQPFEFQRRFRLYGFIGGELSLNADAAAIDIGL